MQTISDAANGSFADTAERHVLVVEDEVLIRYDTAEAFREVGWTVVEAADAHEAIGVIEAGTTPLDAIVTDIRMPGSLSGIDVARRCREVRPACVVVIMSGHFHEGLAESGLYDAAFRKPVAIDDLTHRLLVMVTERAAASPEITLPSSS